MKFNKVLFFAAVTMLLSSCGSKDKKDTAQSNQSGPAKQPPLPVEAIIVSEKELSADIEIPGSLMAKESTAIHPQQPGSRAGPGERYATESAARRADDRGGRRFRRRNWRLVFTARTGGHAEDCDQSSL